MDQYLAKSSDPSWSEMYTSLAQIVKLYPAKMRAIQTQAGEDAVVHIRYDMSSDGKKRFLPRGDHMKSGATVINPKEQEQFQSKAVTM